jgi:hypothetical protein
VANQGKLVAIVAVSAAQDALRALQGHPLGKDARIIGRVTAEHPSMVVMRTPFGTTRIVDMLAGETVDAEARKRPGEKIIAVGLRIMELSSISPDALTFAFEALTREIPWENLKVEIEWCPRRQKCQACGGRVHRGGL